MKLNGKICINRKIKIKRNRIQRFESQNSRTNPTTFNSSNNKKKKKEKQKKNISGATRLVDLNAIESDAIE